MNKEEFKCVITEQFRQDNSPALFMMYSDTSFSNSIDTQFRPNEEFIASEFNTAILINKVDGYCGAPAFNISFKDIEQPFVKPKKMYDLSSGFYIRTVNEETVRYDGQNIIFCITVYLADLNLSDYEFSKKNMKEKYTLNYNVVTGELSGDKPNARYLSEWMCARKSGSITYLDYRHTIGQEGELVNFLYANSLTENRRDEIRKIFHSNANSSLVISSMMNILVGLKPELNTIE